MPHHKEIEVRFLEIDKDALAKKLIALGATDKGETFLEEVIIYDKNLKWLDERKVLRLRKIGDRVRLTYKHHDNIEGGEATEIEFGVDDFEKAEALFTELGYLPYRHQQKKRHSFELMGVVFDIDIWPRIPAYVEIE